MSLIDREILLDKVAQYKSPFKRKSTTVERFAIEATKGDIYRMILEAQEIEISDNNKVVSCAEHGCVWYNRNYHNKCGMLKDVSQCQGRTSVETARKKGLI